MKGLGIALLVIAGLLALIGTFMSIDHSGVSNINLLNIRTNLFLVGGFLMIGGILLIAMVQREQPKSPTSEIRWEIGRRPCPHCKELILAEATVCTFCRRDVEPLKSLPIPSTNEMPSSNSDRKPGSALATRIGEEMATRRGNTGF